MDHFLPPYHRWRAEEMLRYHRERKSAHYFPVIDPHEASRSKIDLVMDNRFDLIGECYHLPEPIDWLANPSDDLEWLILMHKFYYGVGLGVAYRETGDRAYLDKWVSLVSSWIGRVQPDSLDGTSPLNDELFVAVTGRRIQNWIYAHHFFVTENAGAAVPAEFHHRFIDSIRRQVNRLKEELAPARNHRTIELSAIFLASVVFPELRDATGWQQLALDEIMANMEADLLPDGEQCELSTDYHHLVLRNYLNVRRLAKDNDIAVPARMDHLLRKALKFSLHVHKPDGFVPSLSDGDIKCNLDLLKIGADIYRDSEMEYVATRGMRGNPPKDRSYGFPASGYYVVRSGWGEGDRRFEDEQYLVFDCGPLGDGNHGHLDALSFELAAFGKSLIVDPGRYTYSEAGPTNWRVKFRGTAYHNTVLVDGKNQTRYLPGKRKFKIQGPAPDAQLRAFVSEKGHDFLHGVARSHEYDVTHERKIMFVAPDYWVVTDFLWSNDIHDYDLLFHLAPQGKDQIRVETRADSLCVTTQNLVLVQAGLPAKQLVIDDGFVSRIYGEKEVAPILRFNQSGADAVFLTVLYPHRERPPQISVSSFSNVHHEDDRRSSLGLEITIDHDGVRRSDICYFDQERPSDRGTVESKSCPGRYLLVRRDEHGRTVERYGSLAAEVKDADLMARV